VLDAGFRPPCGAITRPIQTAETESPPPLRMSQHGALRRRLGRVPVKTGRLPRFRGSLSIAALGILAVGLTACTGHGGGQLPPDRVVFAGPASFGFDFSCQDSGGVNPPTGQLRIQLSYTDHGSNPIGSSFSIHGIVDTIDPVLESAVCIGKNPPPGGKELIFLGRYWLGSSAPAGFPSTCTARKTATTPSCRFEVIVRDNDMDRAPSTADYFHIALSSGTTVTSQLDPATVFYTRSGLLSSGNLTVD
jgi:hypothetical protein